MRHTGWVPTTNGVKTTTHTYAGVGVYNARLHVNDSAGQVAGPINRGITALNPPGSCGDGIVRGFLGETCEPSRGAAIDPDQ